MLNKIAEAWKSDREHIVASSDKIVRELQNATDASGGAEKVSEGVSDKAYEQVRQAFDAKYGDFGG